MALAHQVHFPPLGRKSGSRAEALERTAFKHQLKPKGLGLRPK
jgi:hypothetical protein